MKIVSNVVMNVNFICLAARNISIFNTIVLPDNINQHFKVLRKCKTKYDCLIYEMLYIRELPPSLNVQSD